MKKYRAEGGPIDGQTIVSEAHVYLVPVPLPWNVHQMRGPDVGYETVEYRRHGRVFRWVGLVDDAKVQMEVSAELFRYVPGARRFVREELRRELDRLAAERDQVVDRIVWVIAWHPLRSVFTVAAIVGGRRSEHAAFVRSELGRSTSRSLLGSLPGGPYPAH